jgi:hypothetical protein
VPDVTCPICAGMTQRRFSKDGYWIRGCDSCGHQFVEERMPEDHVTRVYSDAYFEGGGAGYPGYLSEGPMLRAVGSWYGRLLRSHMAPRSVLSVGIAAGFRVQGLADAGLLDARGLEPNRRMAAYARDQLNLIVDEVPLEEYRSERRYGLVTMFQVAAHFFDLRRAFAAAAEATEPDGFWLVETWNVRSWTARCCGRYWHEYSPPSVLHWFTPESLRCLAEQYGFHEVARGRPRRRISGLHAKSLLRHMLGHGMAARIGGTLARMVPDRLSIPYPGDDLFWALFRRGGIVTPARES